MPDKCYRDALLIGINNYDNYDDLESPKEGTKEFAKILRNLGDFNVKIAPQYDYTSIKLIIHEFFRGTLFRKLHERDYKKDDLLLFYFNGHGDIDVTNEFYFVVEDTMKGQSLNVKGISNSYFRGEILKSPSKTMIFLFDCCYGGKINIKTESVAKMILDNIEMNFEENDAQREEIKREIKSGLGKFMIASSAKNKVSKEIEDTNGKYYSVFTKSIIEGLENGEADGCSSFGIQNGLITMDELFDFVKEKMEMIQIPVADNVNRQDYIVITRNPNIDPPLPLDISLPNRFKKIQKHNILKKAADEDFINDNYKDAKVNYLKVLKLAQDLNDIQMTSKILLRIEECNKYLEDLTIPSISKTAKKPKYEEFVDYHGIKLYRTEYEFLTDLEKMTGVNKSDITNDKFTSFRKELPDNMNVSVNNQVIQLDLSSNTLRVGFYIPDFPNNQFIIKILHVPYISLFSLPENIANLTQLQSLILYYNHDLHSLPDTIGDLKLLKYLELSYNGLKSLPKSIGNLSSLESLKIIHNRKLRTIPDTIGNLESLQNLELVNFSSTFYRELDDDKLTPLPESIGNLSSLKFLKITENNLLRSLPDSIGKLESLQKLELVDNELTSLPKTVGNLSSLKSLKMTKNPFLYSLPDTIGNLKSLQKLELDDNNLRSLPESIGNLLSLEELSICGNCIGTLPESIGNLLSLEKLTIYKCCITFLPDTIGNLVSLKSLNLYENWLKSLPDTIFKLKSLQFLNLEKNHFKRLPKTIKNALKSLYQNGCEIRLYKIKWH